jgi:CxxC-x17-CxxC domain-containing protein
MSHCHPLTAIRTSGYRRDAKTGEIPCCISRSWVTSFKYSVIQITSTTRTGQTLLPDERKLSLTFANEISHSNVPIRSSIAGGRSPARQKAVMEFIDRALTCIDCGGEFMFSAGEQVFFHVKEFRHTLKRCASCRAKHRHATREACPETRTTCSTCGAETTAPFLPSQGRSVLSRPCFQFRQSARARGTDRPGISAAAL